MAKTTSKIGSKLLAPFRKLQQKYRNFRGPHRKYHRSFRRSYREDYRRKTKTHGLLSHAMLTFQTLFKHWRTFLPFLALMVFLYLFTVGVMSEDFYKQYQDALDYSTESLALGDIGNFARAGMLLLSTVTTGGFGTGLSDSDVVIMILLFLIMWMVTLFLLRHFFAGEHPKLRDGLYNALGPLLSTLLIFIVIFIQAIPLMLVIITYSAAVMTGFLSTPFYALLYFMFAATMILLSTYLLSSSIMSLVAVTTPGMYPLKALTAASDLMAERRIKFIIRLLYLILVIALIYIIVMMPVILIDLFVKSWWSWIANWPIVPFFLLATTCFVFIYLTTYIYLYYRWLLDYKEK